MSLLELRAGSSAAHGGLWGFLSLERRGSEGPPGGPAPWGPEPCPCTRQRCCAPGKRCTSPPSSPLPAQANGLPCSGFPSGDPCAACAQFTFLQRNHQSTPGPELPIPTTADFAAGEMEECPGVLAMDTGVPGGPVPEVAGDAPTH